MLDSGAVALLILFLRTIDVSLGTVRTVFAVQGRRVPAAIIGFLEALCFVLAVGIVFSDLGNPIRVAGYAAGFALGTALGVTMVEALKLGTVTVRIVSPQGPIGIADALTEAGFGLTLFDGNGQHGPIRMIVAVCPKRDLERLLAVAKPWLEQCFVTVAEDVVQLAPYPTATAAGSWLEELKHPARVAARLRSPTALEPYRGDPQASDPPSAFPSFESLPPGNSQQSAVSTSAR